MSAPVVEVVRRRVPRPAAPPSAPLPDAVVAVLEAIVRDMRDVPRDCLRDPAELFIWLRRMAGRVEGVGRMRVPGGELAQKRKLTPMLVSAPRLQPQTTLKNGTSLAEAVFGNAPQPGAKSVERRTVTSRKGRAVPVEIRRARAAGQMDLW